MPLAETNDDLAAFSQLARVFIRLADDASGLDFLDNFFSAETTFLI